MDIGMKRDQYEKFIRIAPEQLAPEYLLEEWKLDPNYGLPFAKVEKRDTLMIETAQQDSRAYRGIYVDVFPYDRYASRPWRQGARLRLLRTMIKVKSGIKTWKEGGRTNIRRMICNFPIRILAAALPRRVLIRRYERTANLANDRVTGEWFPQSIHTYGKWVIPSSVLESTMEVPFEDTSFCVPEEYDTYLKRIYGDYRKLPPESERMIGHGVFQVKI